MSEGMSEATRPLRLTSRLSRGLARIARPGKVALLTWLLSSLAFGCAGEPAQSGTSASAIVGATTASDYPEAALIDMPGSACSGAVIAPYVVLTAGHCVEGRSSWTVTAPYANGQRAEVASFEVYDYNDPGEQVNPNQHDIGLLYLATPIRMARYPKLSAAPIAEGAALVNVGRIADGQLSTTDLFVGAPVAAQDGAATGFPFAYATAELIESGDSGGPVLVAGSQDHEIAAVNSGGGGGSQILARVDLLHAWIEERVAAHGGRATTPAAAAAAAPTAGAPPAFDAAAPCAAMEREPNDTTASASPLGQSTCGTLTAGDADWLSFALSSGNIRYAVELAAQGDAVMVIWKQTQDGAWQRLDRDGRRVENVSSYGGRYLVGVSSPTRQAQAYRVALSGTRL